MAKITVQNTDISIVRYNDEDYINLTDMTINFYTHMGFKITSAIQ